MYAADREEALKLPYFNIDLKLQIEYFSLECQWSDQM